ncbi:hypothetical protein J1605_016970 [Eschrichtius robustus]|uniref:Selenoprotein S n=1 Tax=Eschrichtius robustus TaxID=9764 RepID=A0AB34HZG1_ESCRO|nr:hypothetical protein J1605_016970 [Eschrichtius robustus]
MATMERDGDQLSTRPALETEGLRFLHVTVGSLLATYGWYIVFSCILLYVVFQKLSTRLRALRQRQLDRAAAALEPDIVVKRQEALAAARLKMQDELNAQVEKHKEKLRQVTTLCLVKEVEPAPGDLDAEVHRLVDEAKNLVSVAFDTSKMNP